MIKGDYDYLKSLANYNQCAEHHSPVVVAWYGPDKCWTLRCGEDHYPDTLTRQLSLTQAYKAGEEIPEPIKSNIEKGIRRRQMQQGKQVIPRIHEGVPNKDLATGELLAPEQVKALMDYAYKYHLDPFRGHLVLMYGKPYVTIDGYLYHAKQEKIPYSLSGRPLTNQELKQRGYKLGDLGHISFVKRLDNQQEFEGVGFITQKEIEEEAKGKPEQKRYPVVAEKPGQMIQKRAEWQALRRAFPIGESS